MKKDLKELLVELKENNEDMELYPSTPELLQPIFDHIRSNYYRYHGRGGIDSILDIGAGTGNFKKYLTQQDIRDFKFYAMEKSKILIDRLDKDYIMLGTDFNESTLIDKECDCIFSNPPYSEFEKWTKRIISEANCKYIYLIIPERWKYNEEITQVIKETNSKYEILYTGDFLDAERQARAKVDVIVIDKSNAKKDYAFDKWFDETFEIEQVVKEKPEEKQERIKTDIAESTNKVDALVRNYNEDRVKLLNTYKAIATMDEELLSEVGVNKSTVKASLKARISGLKVLYWKLAMDNLDEIVERLTHDSRDKLMNKFKEVTSVDFDHKNIYSLVIWVIKNAYSFYNDQTVDFYKSLSEDGNVKLYKSNQKLFKDNGWKFNRWDALEKNKYNYLLKLDYRLICSKSVFHSSTYLGYTDEHGTQRKLNDIKVVCKNLGFEVIENIQPSASGKDGFLYFMLNGKKEVLAKYKYYGNGNCHIKFHVEFTQALNIVVGRILGWLRTTEQAKEELPEEMQESVDKYFTNNNGCMLSSNTTLMLTMK